MFASALGGSSTGTAAELSVFNFFNQAASGEEDANTERDRAPACVLNSDGGMKQQVSGKDPSMPFTIAFGCTVHIDAANLKLNIRFLLPARPWPWTARYRGCGSSPPRGLHRQLATLEPLHANEGVAGLGNQRPAAHPQYGPPARVWGDASECSGAFQSGKEAG